MSNLLLSILVFLVSVSYLEGISNEDKTVVLGDLPYIGCDVCLKTMTQIYIGVEMAKYNAPNGKLKEASVFEVVEEVCDASAYGGSWMRQIDIVEYKEDGVKYLAFNEPGGVSACGRECGTIEKSCKNLLDEEIDQDELTVLIWQNKFKSAKELQDKACRELTKRCTNGDKNTGMKNKSKRVDFPFKLITEREIEVEKMLKGMKGTGQTLFSTAELQDMNRSEDDEDNPDYVRGETIDEDGNTRINF